MSLLMRNVQNATGERCWYKVQGGEKRQVTSLVQTWRKETHNRAREGGEGISQVKNNYIGGDQYAAVKYFGHYDVKVEGALWRRL